MRVVLRTAELAYYKTNENDSQYSIDSKGG